MLLHRDPTCPKLWAEALLRGRFAGHLQKCNLPKNYTDRRGILCRGYCRKSSAPRVPAGSLLPSHEGLQGQGMVFLNAGSEAPCALPRCSVPARRTQGPARGGQEGDTPPGHPDTQRAHRCCPLPRAQQAETCLEACASALLYPGELPHSRKPNQIAQMF